MNRNVMIYVALQLLILLYLAQSTWCEYPDWEEPHVWAQRKVHSNEVTTEHRKDDKRNYHTAKPHFVSDNNDNLLFFYKKIVKFLLNRDKMKFDDSSKIFYRSLHLHINEEQMKRFDEMTDVRDIDQLVAEVLHQSGSGTLELFQEMYLTWKDTFLHYWKFLQSSRQFIIGIQFAAFVSIWFASRKLKFSFRVVAFFFVLYYLYSFLDAECHRKKEIEKAAEMFGMKKENPCNATRSFWSYYFQNTNTECRKYLKNTYDESCTLIDIYEEFVNVFVYKQLWNFIDNSIANILKVYVTHGIICAFIVALTAVYLFNNYIQLTVVSIFKYILAPLSHKSTNAHRSSHQIDNHHNEDRISGENLKKILNILDTRDHQKLSNVALQDFGRRTLIRCPNSGVQEIDNVDGIEDSKEDEIIEKVENDESEPFVLIDDVTKINCNVAEEIKV